MREVRHPPSASAEVLAGCTAGVLGTLLGFPLDSIKTRMQAGASGGMLPLARRIIEAEGWRGLYRGVASPLLALTILNSLNFSSYAFFRREFGVQDDADFSHIEYRVPLAAACVGPLSSLISTPFEMVKTQAVQSIKNGGVSSTSSSSLALARSIVHKHGLRALYTAHSVNTAREMVFLSTYFSVYEHSKSLFRSLVPANVAIMLAGGLSGATGWFISFPLDCIKSNLQGRQLGQLQPSAASILLSLVHAKGIAGLYSGVVPSIARAFVVSSSRFLAYESTLWVCSTE